MKGLDTGPCRLALAAVLVARGLSVATEEDAAYTVRLIHFGADVVANGSGTLNLAGFYPRRWPAWGRGLYAKGAVFGIDPVRDVDSTRMPTGPRSPARPATARAITSPPAREAAT